MSQNKPRNNNRNQQRRGRGGRSGGSGGRQQQQAPKGPAMTALGESTYEAVFDHGGEGYGVWFDGMVREDPMYKQFWKGTGMRPIYVKIDQDQILITKQLDRPDPANSLDEPEEAASNGSNGAGDDEMVYSPEEAARLFAAEGTGDADDDDEPIQAVADEPAADEDAEEAPKKRTVRARKKPAADENSGDE